MPIIDTSHSRRNWFRLIAVVVILLTPCCWLLVKMREAKVQYEAVQAIKKAGGSVIYQPSSEPEWLDRLLGDDLFANVFDATFAVSATDIQSESLKGLPHLRSLHLSDTKITDAGLKQVKGLHQIRFLFLFGTKVTDHGLEELKGLTQLRMLDLSYTQVTDTGLEYLKGFAQLQSLSLPGTRTSDAGLEHLKGLTSLQMLRLRGTQVSDAGVKKLQSALPKCRIER
jgi:hypothetical protein